MGAGGILQGQQQQQQQQGDNANAAIDLAAPLPVVLEAHSCLLPIVFLIKGSAAWRSVAFLRLPLHVTSGFPQSGAVLERISIELSQQLCLVSNAL